MKGGNQMNRMTRLFQVFRAPSAETVHFHRGPQGQPAPCYDAGCPMPRLSLED
jgi:hypothetical protein